MKTTWRHTPGSKQHWLYRGSSYGGRILGMVYEVNPTSFAVYKENPPPSWNVNNREFLAKMPTLEEAKDMLVTITASQQL